MQSIGGMWRNADEGISLWRRGKARHTKRRLVGARSPGAHSARGSAAASRVDAAQGRARRRDWPEGGAWHRCRDCTDGGRGTAEDAAVPLTWAGGNWSARSPTRKRRC